MSKKRTYVIIRKSQTVKPIGEDDYLLLPPGYTFEAEPSDRNIERLIRLNEIREISQKELDDMDDIFLVM